MCSLLSWYLELQINRQNSSESISSLTSTTSHSSMGSLKEQEAKKKKKKSWVRTHSKYSFFHQKFRHTCKREFCSSSWIRCFIQITRERDESFRAVLGVEMYRSVHWGLWGVWLMFSVPWFEEEQEECFIYITYETMYDLRAAYAPRDQLYILTSALVNGTDWRIHLMYMLWSPLDYQISRLKGFLSLARTVQYVHRRAGLNNTIITIRQTQY